MDRQNGTGRRPVGTSTQAPRRGQNIGAGRPMPGNGYPGRPAGRPDHAIPGARPVRGSMPRQMQGRPRISREEAMRRRQAHERAMRIRAARRRKLLFALAALAVVILAVVLIAGSCSKDEAQGDASNISRDDVFADASENAEQSPESEPTVAYPVLSEDMKELVVDSQFGVLLRLSDNSVIAGKGASERIYPASMVKIMTLVVALENAGGSPDDVKFTFDAAMIAPLYAENATLAGFSAGETVSLKDMLYGLILPSGADAASGIALCVCKSEAAFVDKMNETARRIGMRSTHFTNPTGLHDDDQYSTCTDIALLLEYAMQNKTAAEILSEYKYTTAKTDKHPDGIELTSTLFSRMEGGEPETMRVYAGKTGYTTQAGNCLASYAENDATGEGYIMVTAKGASIWKPIFDHINTYKATTAAGYDPTGAVDTSNDSQTEPPEEVGENVD